ncbi:MAG: HEPN domain-containing protein [Bacteroidetes bacterium]|nr:HEPN domain-containing protein [Bacteroidota bacterium]MCL5738635.1 HEPN domain-containing protein [Bacteroidota bacterium]
MNELVREWVEKARSDYHTAEREISVEVNPNWDGVCFHCQQCIEKLLKALLQKSNTKFSKTHDLEELLRLILPAYPALSEIRDGLEWLTVFAVEIRYPGESALKEDAEKSCKITKECWAMIMPLIENE